MRRIGTTMMAISAWLCLWLVLAGADRGCFYVAPDCAELGEQACIDDEDCQPVYAYPNRQDYGCGSDELRCIGAEPEFDYCEEIPDCEGLGEQACLAEGACQAIYGYPDDVWAYGDLEGGGDRPSCAPGTRCMLPPEEFIECISADADPCEGLGEEECWRRPVCEAEYSYGGCTDEYCWDGYSYEGCHLLADECRTAEDCYLYNDDVAEPGCANSYFTCEAGQCVFHCETGECSTDAECAEGERCEIYCGNGWCDGVCVPDEYECQTDDDCDDGQYCEPLPNVDCWLGEPCPGTCQPGVWTFNEPMQCGGNPWEIDAQQNPSRYAECEVDCTEGTDCGFAYTEICRVRVFFRHQGIWLHDVRDVHAYDEVCGACACPRGDIIYALVAPYDVERILDYGFELY